MVVGMPTPTTPTIAEAGPAFRAARVGAGLGVRDIATYVRRSHTTISRWERGEREISEDLRELLTDALADYLAGTWKP
jgi:transcriptional regulator with XRE-family HTH domain